MLSKADLTSLLDDQLFFSLWFFLWFCIFCENAHYNTFINIYKLFSFVTMTCMIKTFRQFFSLLFWNFLWFLIFKFECIFRWYRKHRNVYKGLFSSTYFLMIVHYFMNSKNLHEDLSDVTSSQKCLLDELSEYFQCSMGTRRVRSQLFSRTLIGRSYTLPKRRRNASIAVRPPWDHFLVNI